jgi:hypothetical protein
MPEDMALAKAFCTASEDEHVHGASHKGVNFKKGIGRCYTMFVAAQVAKDRLDYLRLSM